MAAEKGAPDESFADEFAELERALDRLESDARAALDATAPRGPAAAGEPTVPELERELAQSRATFANLFVRLSRERRHARAALLAVKRRLRSFQRSGKSGGGAAAERELSDARASVAALLREVARRDRAVRAQRLLRGRAARTTYGPRAARPEDIPESVAPSRLAAAHHLDERLRALADAPPADPAAASEELDECRRLALVLRLCAALGAEPGAEDALDPTTAVERRLAAWEPVFLRRHVTFLSELPRRLPRVAASRSDLDALVDAAVGHALGRLPRNGIMLVRADAAEGAPLRLEFQDNGAGAPAIPSVRSALASGKRMSGLELGLARELAERRGGALIAGPVPSGRGLRVTVILRAAAGRSK